MATLTAEQQAVADANDAFYHALSVRDLHAMTMLWFPADWCECVHPGTAALRGWPAVRESWAAIFSGPGDVIVTPVDVNVRLVGDVAWVTCVERIAATTDGDLVTTMAHALNLFVRHDGEWRMVVHHASPLPILTPPMPDGGSFVN